MLAKGLREQQSSFVNLTLGGVVMTAQGVADPSSFQQSSRVREGSLGSTDHRPAGSEACTEAWRAGSSGPAFASRCGFGCFTSIVLEIGVFSSGRVVRSGDELP